MRLPERLFLTFLAVAPTGCSDEARIEKAGKRCTGGDMAACSQLEQLAKGDGSGSEKDGARRMLAVYALTEQGALGRVAPLLAKEGLDGACANAASKLTDKAALVALVDAMMTLLNANTCSQAAWKSLHAVISDRELFELAMKGNIVFEAQAVTRIKDESLLLQLMRKPGKGISGLDVVARLQDQANLATIAAGAEFEDLARWAAVEKLTDRQLLSRLAKDPGTSYRARRRLEELGKP